MHPIKKAERLLFPYSVEITCPDIYSDNANLCPIGQLSTRHWDCKRSRDQKVEVVEGAGVIGLFPKIYPGAEVFTYESCTHESNWQGGEMKGYFSFELEDESTFTAMIEPFKFDIAKTHWF